MKRNIVIGGGVVMILLSLLCIFFLYNKKEINTIPKDEIHNIVWNQSLIVISGKTTLSINDFPDGVQVAPDAAFGSSDRIDDAKLSPDGKWVAVGVSGAAHGFGWLYEVASRKLSPVAFSYGGGVAVKGWKSDTEVIFTITTPKPDTFDISVDVNHLPEYAGDSSRSRVVPASIPSPIPGDGPEVLLKEPVKSEAFLNDLLNQFNEESAVIPLVYGTSQYDLPENGVWSLKTVQSVAIDTTYLSEVKGFYEHIKEVLPLEVAESSGDITFISHADRANDKIICVSSIGTVPPENSDFSVCTDDPKTNLCTTYQSLKCFDFDDYPNKSRN